MSPAFLHRTFLGNEVIQFATALGLFAAGFAAVSIFRYVLLRRAEAWAARTQSQADDFLIGALRQALIPALYFGALYLALRSLHLNPGLSRALTAFGTILVTFMAVRFLVQIVRFSLFGLWLRRRKEEAPVVERQLKALMPVVSILIWGLGVVFLLDNLGFKVSAIVTGLGIGGVAVALASQAVLGDFFAYFAIMMDRPFELDDFIIVGDLMGMVEHIGIKTTRIRSLHGEQLVFSNKDLTDSRIRNFKRMQERRVLFKLGVTYGTSAEKLRRAVQLVSEIIQRTPGTRLDRVHFMSFGDFSLVLEAVYFVLSPDYLQYADLQQSINLTVKEAFESEGIEFAFPTQTIQLVPAGRP